MWLVCSFVLLCFALFCFKNKSAYFISFHFDVIYFWVKICWLVVKQIERDIKCISSRFSLRSICVFGCVRVWIWLGRLLRRNGLCVKVFLRFSCCSWKASCSSKSNLMMGGNRYGRYTNTHTPNNRYGSKSVSIEIKIQWLYFHKSVLFQFLFRFRLFFGLLY